MIRRISTKWVLAVLGVVVLPLLGYALFVHTKVRDRLAGEVVRYHLLSLVAELTGRLDNLIEERRLDLEHLVTNPLVAWQLALQLHKEDEDGVDAPFEVWHDLVQESFDRFAERSRVYDLVLSVDANGRMVAHSRVRGDGRRLDPERTATWKGLDFSNEPWFREALETGSAQLDHHRSSLLAQPGLAGPDARHIGFVSRIELEEGEVVGVVLVLMNWRHVQEEVSSYGVRRLIAEQTGGEGVGEDIYKTSYAWVWSSDADTILAHPDATLLGERVSGPRVALPQMVAAARASEWGLYPDYRFQGVPKKAAFKHCRGRNEGGFGWVVGVGVDDADIYEPVADFLRWLWIVSASVLGLASLWTVFLAHRITRPIQALTRHTRRIASGDLDARIEVTTRDELGELAEAFNSMTGELKEKREQLVRVEKEGAWREMARQVAHEIKNPLTPINLSAGLLERSYREKSPEFDSILTRTIALIRRQVESMREIATDFHAFAGEQRIHVEMDVGEVLGEVLDLNEAWASDLGVRITRSGGGGKVFGDPAELRRAFLNLVSNALEAMPDGGELDARVAIDEHLVTIELRDTGVGLSDDALGKLFEPYFTTRTSGTGLGLAIVRRVIEDMGGSVALENREGGAQGAVARIVLPRSS